MILYINASPKLRSSNSEYFLKKIDKNSKIIHLYKEEFDSINLEEADTIIFSFPLYVDAPPNRVLEFFEYIDSSNKSLENKNIYTICNCGFLEAYQNDTAIEIFKNFCLKNKANFKGSFKIGAGEIVGRCDRIKIYRLISLGFLKKIKKFRKSISKGEYIELETTIHPMSRKMYKFLANISWRRKCRKNKIKKIN